MLRRRVTRPFFSFTNSLLAQPPAMTYQQPLLLFFLLATAAGLVHLRRGGRAKAAVVAWSTLLLFTWPPMEWVISRSLESAYLVQPIPSADANAIVVLASGVHPPIFERPFPLPDQETYSRTRFAGWLYQHWKPLPVVVCGGVGYGGPEMRAILVAAGVPDNQIWAEQQSRTTYENALYGSGILRSHHIQRIALVVEAQSMMRAAACFRKQGMIVVPAPSEFREFGPLMDELLPSGKSIIRNEITAHELLGLVWYRIRGWV